MFQAACDQCAAVVILDPDRPTEVPRGWRLVAERLLLCDACSADEDEEGQWTQKVS